MPERTGPGHQDPHKMRVLVTGAAGKIGRHVVDELVNRGYSVRALTTKSVGSMQPRPGLEWRQFDWHKSNLFDELVRDCGAVLHLGAELLDIDRMQRSNVDATRELVRASEGAGVRFFCYVSSVAVYGSALKPIVTEESLVLTHDRDVRTEYFAEDYLRAYGRTKLGGERALQAEAKQVDYVILRPTVVVDVDDIAGLKSWSAVKKAMAGYRHSHQIYVLDVVHAMLWFMEESIAGQQHTPDVNVYNLSNDDISSNTYGRFFRDAYLKTSDPDFRTIELPSIFDRLRDILKFRLLPVRYSLGAMIFSTDKLYATGYRHRYGIVEAQQRAFNLLKSGPIK